LKDGTPVAVKVQYPGIEKAMRADLKNGKVAGLLNRALFVHTDVKAIVDELEERLLDECDYRKEADYQAVFAARFASHAHVVVPRVHREVSSQRVLVTTLERGRTFYEWLQAAPDAAARDRATRTFYRFYLGSFYLDGLFNCDPHPGNYLFRDDGRIVFLDYGCCRRFPDERRRAWISMAQAVRRDDPAEMDRAGRVVGFIPPGVDYDRPAFRALMRYLYEPYLVDEAYDFALHRPAKTFRSMFTDNPNLFRMNMPADAVFLNRITFGLVSLLAEIGSPLNTYRIADAYFARRDPDWPDDPALAA
jgi:predicted unusual protein kinase regulating ubiquinone biosynthesis (AarF/ABC1/UbiB family)